MELKLNKPICFFDLETTGIDIGKDRIVEISIFKVFPNGNKESKTWLVNPTIPIPPETTAFHGITDEKVANEPTFAELASQVYAMIKDSDLAGFNSDRFDIPLLAEEMLRAGVDFDMKNRVSVDVQTVFHKMEERTLRAAHQFYCGKMIAFDKDDEEIFTFGKHKGVKVDKILETEPGYFSWIQNADFPLYTKKVLTAIKLRKLNTK